MGNTKSGPEDKYEERQPNRGSRNNLNMHQAQQDIKIHSTVSFGLDCDHDSAMKLPLGEVIYFLMRIIKIATFILYFICLYFCWKVSDEQLLAEVARRKLDLHNQITDALVRESYNFEGKLGKGASGEVLSTISFSKSSLPNPTLTLAPRPTQQHTHAHNEPIQVLLVSNKLTGVKYACKIIAKNDSMNDAQSMSTEMEIMKRIRHRNIVSMYELVI